jgi:hypothetical protein
MFPRNVKNLENTENHCFRQSVKTLINVTFWEVFPGQKRKKTHFSGFWRKKVERGAFLLSGALFPLKSPQK